MENNPYAAPGAVVDDASVYSGDDLEARKAGRLQRLGAVLLDSLFYCICIVPIAMPAYQNYLARARGVPVSQSSSSAMFLGLCGVIAIGLFIYNLVLLHRNGQTIGKRLVGIKIVRTNGEAASLGRIFFARMLAMGVLRSIPFIGPFISLIDVLMIFGNEKRCLHDLIADTIVIQA
jgi:uncharacterized RDD family membrane protein YckC